MSIEGEVLVPDATTIKTDHADDAQDSLNNIKRSNNEELSITNQLSSSLNTLSFKEKTPPKDYPSREERYAAQVEADSRSIFVGNIASEITPETIEDHFKNCGTIKRITLLYDKKTGVPKGYSYVEFDSIEAQNNALEYNGSELLGTTITVYKKRTNLPGFSRRSRYQKPNVYYQQHWSDPYNYLVENTGYPQTSLGFDRSNGLQNSDGGHRRKGAYRRHRRKGQQYQSNSFLDSSNSDNKGSSLETNIIDQSDTRS